MSKVVLLCLALSLALPEHALAEIKKDVSEMDGVEWLGSSFVYKISFISGFMAGVAYAVHYNVDFPNVNEERVKQIQKIMASSYTDKQKQGDKQIFSRNDLLIYYQNATRLRSEFLKNYAIYEITAGQIVAGLDKLYEDFKNRRIRVQDAIYIVRKQIKGASEEEVEAALQYLRSDKDSEKIRYKKKSGEVAWVDFP